MPGLIKHQFVEEETNIWTSFKKSIKDLLYDKFISSFALFKQSPDAFFDNISQELVDAFNETLVEEDVNIEQLRNTLLRFF